MRFSEDDLLPISALQHLKFCERQCALIHIERAWEENRLTAEGRVLHENADEPGTESRRDVRIARALSLRSLRLGLIGKADVVEFHLLGEEQMAAEKKLVGQEPEGETSLRIGVPLDGQKGLWKPFPVEYKRGKPKANTCDEIQLCAQALCLEEMLGVWVPEGALFYGLPRRRTAIVFGTELRAETEQMAERLQDLIRSGKTPPPIPFSGCDNCSLIDRCLPKTGRVGKSAKTYLDKNLL